MARSTALKYTPIYGIFYKLVRNVQIGAVGGAGPLAGNSVLSTLQAARKAPDVAKMWRLLRRSPKLQRSLPWRLDGFANSLAVKEKNMRPRWNLTAPLVVALVATCGWETGAELLTMEQAEKLSKATGRPILAMAGSKT